MASTTLDEKVSHTPYSENQCPLYASPTRSETLCCWPLTSPSSSPTPLHQTPTDTSTTSLHPSHYQARLSHLILAQCLVVLTCFVAPYISPTWTNHDRASSLLTMASSISHVGLIVQALYHVWSPRRIEDALEQLEEESTRSRALIFLTTLWFPYLPFLASVFLFTNSVMYVI